jgi:hypothetical protein
MAYYWPLIWAGIGGALCSFLIWAFAVQLSTAFVFAILFGFCMGGTASVWIRATYDMTGERSTKSWLMIDQPMAASISFGWMNVGKGLSAVASAFIASSVFNESKADVKQLYGSYGASTAEHADHRLLRHADVCWGRVSSLLRSLRRRAPPQCPPEKALEPLCYTCKPKIALQGLII